MPQKRSFEVRVPIGRHPSEPVARAAVPEAIGILEDGTDGCEEATALRSPKRPDKADEGLDGKLKEVKSARTSCIVIASNPTVDLAAAGYKPGDKGYFTRGTGSFVDLAAAGYKPGDPLLNCDGLCQMDCHEDTQRDWCIRCW